MAPPWSPMHPPRQAPPSGTWTTWGMKTRSPSRLSHRPHRTARPFARQVSSPGHEQTAESRPGTFSNRSQRGRSSSASRMMCRKSPERAPPKPARRPATEKSWQGLPPARIPRPGTKPAAMSWSPVTSVTSLNRAVRGKWRRSTPRHSGSISTAATTLTPARSRARSIPPIPANRETAVRSLTSHPLARPVLPAPTRSGHSEDRMAATRPSRRQPPRSGPRPSADQRSASRSAASVPGA